MNSTEIIDRGRGPEIKGTRTTVYNLVPYFLDNWQPSEIAAACGLSSEQVLAMVEYFEAHKDEVMVVHKRIEARNAKGNSPEVEARRPLQRAKVEALRE